MDKERKNYRSYSDPAKEDLANEIVREPVKEPVEPVNVEVREPVNKTNAKVVDGKIVNCFKVNVRKEPSLNAKIMGTLDQNTDVNVTVNIPDDDSLFYKVLSGKLYGYVMKDFIHLYE